MDEAFAEIQRRVGRLQRREMIGRSQDERVVVRVTGDGRVTQVRLLDDVLRRYDNAALAELVTRTVRATQRRAQAAIQQEVDALYAPFREDGATRADQP
jgi:DNA-binding protein YbaB